MKAAQEKRRVKSIRLSAALALLMSSVLPISASSASAQSAWNAGEYAAESTLDFFTDCAEEGTHWTRVWLVVLDGQMYVRLGKPSAARVDCNTAKPYVKIRIGGRELPKVKFENRPEMATAVAAAMKEKYWSDFTVSWLAHPYTMRVLVEE